MVTPKQKWVYVLALVGEFGVSESRACLVVGQYRSTQRLGVLFNAQAGDCTSNHHLLNL